MLCVLPVAVALRGASPQNFDSAKVYGRSGVGCCIILAIDWYIGVHSFGFIYGIFC
jgi:hypothetical protein